MPNPFHFKPEYRIIEKRQYVVDFKTEKGWVKKIIGTYEVITGWKVPEREDA